MTAEDKLARIRQLTQEWVDKQSHDRCWYYPELFEQIVQLLGISPSKLPMLPPEREFEHGCDRYRQEQYRQRHSPYRPHPPEPFGWCDD